MKQTEKGVIVPAKKGKKAIFPYFYYLAVAISGSICKAFLSI